METCSRASVDSTPMFTAAAVSALRKSNESWNKMRDVTTPPSEEELYQEYQNEVKNSSRNSSKLTSTASNKYDFDEVSLSFEEWKIEKKKFKAGTRYSLTHSSTYSLIYLLTHSSTYSLTHSFIYILTYIH